MHHHKNDLSTNLQNIMLVVIGGVLVWSVLSKQIFWYVRPDYHTFTLVMGVVALFLGWLGFWTPAHHDHHEQKVSKTSVFVTVALLVALSGYLVFFHRSSLSPRAANNRGLNQNAVTGTNSVFDVSADYSPLLEAGDSEHYNMADWIRLFRVNPDPWSHKGKPVKVVGFVQPANETSFFLSRFVISCCTVDASPIGILVQSSERFSEGKWLEVSGTMDATEHDGKVQPMILPQNIQEIPEPEQPYLY